MIELIVGIGLISIGIIGMNSLAVSAIHGNLSARLADQATRLAQQKLEQVINAGYAAAAPSTTVESNLDYAGNPGGLFTRTTSIAAGSLAMTRTITATIAWTDRGPQHISFLTQVQGVPSGSSRGSSSAGTPPGCHGEDSEDQ